MKILIDIGHPAHVHFFREPMRLWREAGSRIFVTSRQKEIATELLDAAKIDHEVLSSMNRGTIKGMAVELWQRDRRLLQVIRREQPDILVGIGGIFIAHAGLLSHTPSVVFYDTENATLQNLLTYPFCSLVVVPSCYQAWLPPRHLRYPGYHELSYLHPDRFQPSREIALRCGLDPDRPTFLIRTVSWQASHDLREKGWSEELLRRVTNSLLDHGKVLISAEGRLPDDLQPHCYRGERSDIHHLMAYLRLFIGESATMASECAVLGVPAIYAAETGRGYTDEQEKKYGLVTNVRTLDWPDVQQAVASMLAVPSSAWSRKRELLLQDTIDVSRFVADLVSGYPDSVARFRKQFTVAGEN